MLDTAEEKINQNYVGVYPALGFYIGFPHMFTGFVVVFFCSPSSDPTRVMVPPSSMDVTVGESIVLPCQVTHDHSLAIVFTWSFNGHLIDFDKDGDHFERVGGVSINIRPSVRNAVCS